MIVARPDKARARGIRCFWLALGIFLLSGCGSSSRPAGQLVAVQGVVLFNGMPLPDETAAEVLFIPLEKPQPTSPVPRARVASGGSYTLKTAGYAGAPPGNYRVVVLLGDSKPLAGQFDRRYSSQQQSSLLVEVVENKPAGAYDLVLLPKGQ